MNGFPSASNSSSALPWSAVINIVPPNSRTFSYTSPIHSSTTLTALIAAGITPVCPTMSQFAKLTITTS